MGVATTQMYGPRDIPFGGSNPVLCQVSGNYSWDINKAAQVIGTMQVGANTCCACMELCENSNISFNEEPHKAVG